MIGTRSAPEAGVISSQREEVVMKRYDTDEAPYAFLLEAEQLDRLPLVGSGFAGQVLRHKDVALKVAHPTKETRRRVQEELAILEQLQAGEWAIPTPQLYAVRDDRAAFVREYLTGPSLYQELQEAEGVLEEERLSLLFSLFQEVERYRQETSQVLDFAPVNLFFCAKRGSYVLCDLGQRLAPSPFHVEGLTQERFGELLKDYLPWRAQLDAPTQLQRMLLPPSGRFHVEVPMGPIEAGKVLWANEHLKQELGLDWSHRKLRSIGGIATHAPKKTTTLPASLYQDSPGKGDGHAKGDGRAVYVGQLPQGLYGRKELMLKGCGPTPLVWMGNEFHEDGFVSFQRTLWEVTVADELGRLGFETPEMLAVLGTGKSTIDNTLIEWPAGAAIRVANTHYRSGHLIHWSDTPETMKTLMQHVGRLVLREDFDPGKITHLRAFLKQFSQNLGYDIGRSDVLNIHGFNPTIGNVRVDGHLLDFSTIRFFRHYMPHFKYMNNTRKVREHKAAMRRHPPYLVSHMQQGGLLTQVQARQLVKHTQDWYDESYFDGYLAGLCTYIGCQPEQLNVRSRRRLRGLIQDTIQLRRLRAKEVIEFPFWKQKAPAPLFDFEGKMPDLISSWRRGERSPWKNLRSDFAGELRPFDACIVRSWFATIKALIPPGLLRRLKPKRWEQVIRPFMEVERLADLCYHQSTPASFETWKRCLATRRQLEQGSYDYFQARQGAHTRGHLAFPGLQEGQYEYVIGMTEELYSSLLKQIEAHFGEAVLGVFAYGPRVMTYARQRQLNPNLPPKKREQLVEAWVDDPLTSKLFLAICLEQMPPTPNQAAKLCEQALNQLDAPFVIKAQQHRPLLVHTPQGRLDEALTALPWLRVQPAHVVRLYDPFVVRPKAPMKQALSMLPQEAQGPQQELSLALCDLQHAHYGMDTESGLSVHTLEMLCRDQPQWEPRGVMAQPLPDGSFSITKGLATAFAAQQAGRHSIQATLQPSKGRDGAR